MIGQRGIGMAELLVALLVGLLVLLFAGRALVAANRSHAELMDGAEIDAAGHFALDIVGRSVRQVAFVNWERAGADAAVDPDGPAHILGLDNHTVSRAGNGVEQAVMGAVNGSDALALRFSGAGKGAGGDGSMINCGGFGVGEHDEGWSIFYVARAASGDMELRCKYRAAAGWGADAIVGGVDTFQVLYGLDTDMPADGIANVYVSADMLQAMDGVFPEDELNRKTNWKRVVSIKVGLLLHGQRESRAGLDPEVIDVFGADYAQHDLGTRIAEADMVPALRARERRLFSTTIALRNPERSR